MLSLNLLIKTKEKYQSLINSKFGKISLNGIITSEGEKGRRAFISRPNEVIMQTICNNGKYVREKTFGYYRC